MKLAQPLKTLTKAVFRSPYAHILPWTKKCNEQNTVPFGSAGRLCGPVTTLEDALGSQIGTLDCGTRSTRGPALGTDCLGRDLGIPSKMSHVNNPVVKTHTGDDLMQYYNDVRMKLIRHQSVSAV
jgi:hypothetical protein